MLKRRKRSSGIFSVVLTLALIVPMTFWVRAAAAQVMHQDLKQQYEQEQKDLSAQKTNQNQADENDDVEVGGPPPEDDYSTLSQQDANTIIEAAKALEKDNPELAKKLLDIGNE